MRVTIEHIRTVPNWNGAAGYCAAGARAWCALHGISWPDLVANGIDAAQLRATGDAMALRLVEWAELQEAGKETWHG